MTTFLLDSDPADGRSTVLLLDIGIVPIAVLDAWVSVYQHTCFRVYGIARVRRARYVVFDCQHLRYLNGIEKLNCAYCCTPRESSCTSAKWPPDGGDWCPIRHAQQLRGAHARYREFVQDRDAEG